MIEIEKLEEEESLVTFTVKLPNQELYNLYREIFNREYFQVLGVVILKGGDLMNSSYKWWNRLVSYNADSLMSPDNNNDVVEEAPDVEEKEYIWKIELSKQWGSPVLTEKEYQEMKKASIRDDDLEQDTAGFYVNELNVLAELNEIQKQRKSKILKTLSKIPSKAKYNQTPYFYILPMHKKYYIRLDLSL